MDSSDEADLRARGFKFDPPDHAMQRSAGFGRHWPQARGVFRGHGVVDFTVMVNHLDHLRIRSARSDGDVLKAFELLQCADRGLEKGLVEMGVGGYARHQRLGYLLSDPATLGTGMTISGVLLLPRLAAMKDFQGLCKRLGVTTKWHMKPGSRDKTEWEIGCPSRLGIDEGSQVRTWLRGCKCLIDLEVRAEAGETLDLKSQPSDIPAEELYLSETVKSTDQRTNAPQFETPSISVTTAVNDYEHLVDGADDPAYGKSKSLKSLLVQVGDAEDEDEQEDLLDEEEDEWPGFPGVDCPEELPDLSAHHSLMAEVLRKDPSIYDRLRLQVTSLDVTLARCIKTGMDVPGHAFLRNLGIVAGDAECYDVFQELFDEVIKLKHPDLDPARVRQLSDMDPRKVCNTVMDPQGTHVLGVRARIVRNLEGLRFNPSATHEDRAKVEEILAEALNSLTGEWAGKYYPLRDSQSYEAQPEGMSEAEEAELLSKGIVFEEPDSD